MKPRAPIGHMLVEGGYIDDWQLQRALEHQRSWGGRIGEALVALGFIAEPILLTEVARQLGVVYVEIGTRYVPRSVVQLVPEKLIRARKVFPIAHASRPGRGLVVIATGEPQNLEVLDEVAFATGKLVKPVLASDADIERTIERHLGPGATRWSAGPAPTVRVASDRRRAA